MGYRTFLGIIASIGLLMFAGYSIFDTYSFVGNSNVTTAWVVRSDREEYRRRATSRPNVSYKITVQYYLPNRSRVVATTRNHSAVNLNVGQQLQLRYDRRNPQNVEINDFYNIWAQPLVLFVCGGISMIHSGLRWGSE
jgi:hypothetical protein